MTAADFAAFYYGVHKRQPFPWQGRLVERILRGDGWYEQIALPTASGKTSVLDAAVFALAAQADLCAEERTPLRIFFVVDRRLVVDDVTAHARKIAVALENQDATEIVKEVREGLLRFGGEVPLAVATLRGGMYLNSGWVDAPNQPLVCVSTVDQVGSRLLFRGYGIRPERRPVDAALVGNDSLIILDEAHLSNPFRQTLKRVERLQAEGGALRPLRLVEMSATPRAEDGEVLGLGEEDFENEALASRMRARKMAQLRETTQLEGDAAKAAMELRAQARVVAVVVNTVSSARKIFERLRNAADDNALLLTGRIRPYDRDRLLEKYQGIIRSGSASERSLYVVATQTVEVGADLDFDALITEAAPVDSLRQRFGRLNRMGRHAEAAALILKPKREKELSIYGAATEETWRWLNEHAKSGPSGKVIDFGAEAMGALVDGATAEDRRRLMPIPKDAPILARAFLDSWSCTNPELSGDPGIAPFLHGQDALDDADVQIVWRKDLPEPEGLSREQAQKAWIEALSLLPPQKREALPLPAGQFRRWVTGKPLRVDDLESGTPPVEEDGDDELQKPFLIWRGPEEAYLAQRKNDVRPGDTVVLRSDAGGTDEFGWNPEAKSAEDIGDECSWERAQAGSGRASVRRSAESIAEAAGLKLGKADEDELEEACRQLLELKPRTPVQLYGEREGKLAAAWLIALLEPVKEKEPTKVEDRDEPEDNNDQSLTGEIGLREHTERVVEQARRFAGDCGLAAFESEAIVNAARYHDIGKSDVRFQQLLAPAGSAQLLAKGKKARSRRDFMQRAENAGCPPGFRHEFGSVALAAKLLPEDAEARDLILHLIGTHHGQGRAIAPYWKETGQGRVEHCGASIEYREALDAARFGSGWSERFWRLTERYGWWGLAYLEMILRRADCVVSRNEEKKSDE